jgi:hypothetical protein
MKLDVFLNCDWMSGQKQGVSEEELKMINGFSENSRMRCSVVKNAGNISGMNYRLVQFWVEYQATETSEGNILKRWKLKVFQIMEA